jgi:hypothetical protein
MYANLDNALPTAIIYLKADPDTCLERIKQRQRHGENKITKEYLTKLHQQYEQEVSLFPGPVITLDASKPKAEVAAAARNAIDLLMGAGTLTPKRPYGTCRRLAAAPFLVQDFPILQQLFPERPLTTCDPYLVHLFPDQLLTFEEPTAEPDPVATPTQEYRTNPPTPAVNTAA